MKVQRQPVAQVPSTPTAEVAPSSRAVQLKKSLAGQDIASQEAALAPASQDVQMKPAAVQRAGWEPRVPSAPVGPTSAKANAPGAQGWDLSALNPDAAAAQSGGGGGAGATRAGGGAGAQAPQGRPAPMLQPADIVQQAFTLGGQSRYQVAPQEAMAWIERNMDFAPPEQRFAWIEARKMVNKRL